MQTTRSSLLSVLTDDRERKGGARREREREREKKGVGWHTEYREVVNLAPHCLRVSLLDSHVFTNLL